MDGKHDFERTLPKNAENTKKLFAIEPAVQEDVFQGGSDESSAYNLFQRPLGGGQARQPRLDRVKKPLVGLTPDKLQQLKMFVQFMQRLGY